VINRGVFCLCFIPRQSGDTMPTPIWGYKWWHLSSESFRNRS